MAKGLQSGSLHCLFVISISVFACISCLIFVFFLYKENDYTTLIQETVTAHDLLDINNRNNMLMIQNNEHNRYNLDYMQSFENWIRGLGDNFMLNNITNSNCLFPPSVPFKMDKNQVVNPDITFSSVHHCNTKPGPKFSDLLQQHQ